MAHATTKDIARHMQHEVPPCALGTAAGTQELRLKRAQAANTQHTFLRMCQWGHAVAPAGRVVVSARDRRAGRDD